MTFSSLSHSLLFTLFTLIMMKFLEMVSFPSFPFLKNFRPVFFPNVRASFCAKSGQFSLRYFLLLIYIFTRVHCKNFHSLAEQIGKTGTKKFGIFQPLAGAEFPRNFLKKRLTGTPTVTSQNPSGDTGYGYTE